MFTLKVQNISKSIKKINILSDISFKLESGKILGLLGPNGSGKTTSFYSALGLISIDAGQILLNDEDITHIPFYKRAKKGLIYLPQEPSVFAELSVKDNLKIVLESKKLSRIETHEKLEGLLKEFGLLASIGKKAYQLSGGERRRLEIARCLALDPKFLFLDEPFAGLDPVVILEIKSFLENIRTKGVGILITDHNVQETLKICDSVVVLRNGKVIASGLVEDVAKIEEVKEFYLGSNFRL
ncbi:MAG: LPS export ABC transporter ATP-binding protein [Bdellovibrionaceae bacterium]|nr:LPS export ABC transporter ATP-binding protein [Pseudobdellovibrionaceae bacterium]